MPSLTLGTIMSEATAALGSRLDLSASVVSLHVNIAQQEVAAMLPHTELMTSATLVLGAGSSATVLPTDFNSSLPYEVSRPNSYDSFGYRSLTRVPIREVDNASEGTATGVANRYAVSANSILFYPTTTSQDTFTLRYVSLPVDMTSTGSMPSLHTRYHPAILYKTIENLCDRVVDNSRAAYYRNKFLSVMGATPAPGATQTLVEKS